MRKMLIIYFSGVGATKKLQKLYIKKYSKIVKQTFFRLKQKTN